MNLTQAPPRSAKDTLGGIIALPRLIDKIRASIVGRLGEYKLGPDSAVDSRLVRFLGINLDNVVSVVASGIDDATLLNWMKANGSNPSQIEIGRFTAGFLNLLAKDDPDRQQYIGIVLERTGLDPATTTTFDWLDFDDAHTFPSPHKVERQTLVLVHGAWMDASVWASVAIELEEKGRTVFAVNLPGHGADDTPPEHLSLDGYATEVISAVGKNKVVLVGHGMGGIVISAVAERIPDQIEKLVYVAGYLPRSGESLYRILQEDTESRVGQFWRQADPAHYSPVWIASEGIKECFAADAPAADIDRLVKEHKPEALGPMAAHVTLTPENFGKVAKHYIYTTKDCAVSYSLQQKMVERGSVNWTSTLETSHAPFFSQPEKLARLIQNERLREQNGTKHRTLTNACSANPEDLS